MNKIIITKADLKKYALVKEKDIQILKQIKQLEQKNLDKVDLRMLKFIKSQLERDWRKPLIGEIKKIEKHLK